MVQYAVMSESSEPQAVESQPEQPQPGQPQPEQAQATDPQAKRRAQPEQQAPPVQRLRLRYQLLQHGDGVRPSDELLVTQLSPIDRSVLGQAVREIAAVQKRMANIAVYSPVEEWVTGATRRP